MTEKLKMTVEDVMSIAEAAERYGVKPDTLRDYVTGRRVGINVEDEIERGSLRFYKAKGKQRGEWLVTTEFMESVYLPYQLPDGYAERIKNWRSR